MQPAITRRGFLRRAAGLAATGALAACGRDGSAAPDLGEPVDVRLRARPGEPTVLARPGLSFLGLGDGRDGLLYVPTTYSARRPLLVLLHGAGGSGADWQAWFRRAEERGLVLLAPDSRYRTWDMLLGRFGPDVRFLDRALAHAFDRCRVDPERLALAGFSDGASYALSLGVGNGLLFSHLVAFAPGSYRPQVREGGVQIYVAHGTRDPVLAVEHTRGYTVPRLAEEGYDVTYREFVGGHGVPAEIAEESLDWLAGPLPTD